MIAEAPDNVLLMPAAFHLIDFVRLSTLAVVFGSKQDPADDPDELACNLLIKL